MLLRFLNHYKKIFFQTRKELTTMNINLMTNTITLTKKEFKLSGNPNSELFQKITNLKRDWPNCNIIVENQIKRKDSLKGLNYAYMEKYIKSHDNADENMANYRTLRGLDNQDGLNMSASYGQVRKWFLATYPEIEEYQNKIDAIINKAS